MSAHPEEHPEPQPEPVQPDPDTTEAEAPDSVEEVVQPADAVPAAEMGKVIEFRSGEQQRGFLSLRPNQSELDPEQHAALLAIGIDIKTDPQVLPHLRAFVHMCQSKGLDPFQREAYLIGRGRGENRKYTMQTGIDGYRKMAASTGRFIRVKETLWTGQDDDDRSYHAVPDGKGGVIMRRVWFDQWPAARGYPGAAKVVIEHYDEHMQIVETEAVADWGMYAPYTQAWHWHESQRGKKVYETNDDGSPKMVLNDMWEKGYAHMLAKCAEALADRKAFPSRMNGVYITEEMHRLDQQERERLAAESRRSLAERHAAAMAASTPPAASPQSTAPSDRPAPETRQDTPEAGQDTPTASQTAPTAGQDVDDDTRRRWLLDELGYIAEVLDTTVAGLASRAVRAKRKNIEDFTADELLAVVGDLRQHAVTGLRQTDSAAADRYAELGRTLVVDVALYLDHVTDAEVVEDPVDPEAEHPYVDDGVVCRDCGLPEDVGPHPE